MQTQGTPECGCGCGEHVKSRNVRFLQGHNRRRTPNDYLVDADGCWVWQRAKQRSGYGKAWDDVRKTLVIAHRLYYERHVGPIPEGLVIDHLCRNRACVNPAHLEAVTYAENNARSFFGRDPRTGRMLPEAA